MSTMNILMSFSLSLFLTPISNKHPKLLVDIYSECFGVWAITNIKFNIEMSGLFRKNRNNIKKLRTSKTTW